MAMTSPSVSIGMPVYNSCKYLEETLSSLLGQTFKDFELIISDNASTDNTEQICRDYAKRDERIRYYRNRINLGASRNYNRVFKLSTGKYFKWAAGDDLCAPDYLRRCVSILDNNPEVVICYSRTKIIDERGRVIKDFNDNLHLQSGIPSVRFIKFIRSMRECNAIFGLIRSETLKMTPLIGNYIASDSCLLAELSLYGKYHEIPEFMFFRRNHPLASSNNKETEYQLEFFDPKKKGKIVLPWWRCRYENYVTVKRTPIRWIEKVFLFVFLTLKTIYWGRKFVSELLIAGKQYLSRQLCGKKNRNTLVF